MVELRVAGGPSSRLLEILGVDLCARLALFYSCLSVLGRLIDPFYKLLFGSQINSLLQKIHQKSYKLNNN